jgi:UDP-N-acetylglucosamine 2-epimerase (non-hydrolysing)
MQNIYFFIGTKAQAIKCIPLINFLSNKQNLKVQIVNSGQHAKITEGIFENANKSVSHINLYSKQENISKYLKGLHWMLSFVFKNLILQTLNKPNNSQGNICVVHGDTISTLLGLLWAKRNKCKVLHLESGLTSNSIFNPFPEEIIRKITTRFSAILICFDDDSYKRLFNKYSSKYIFKVTDNTVMETLGNRLEEVKKSNIVTATLHRTENILSKKRLQAFLDLLTKLSHSFEVNWYLHEPTINAIKKHKIQVPPSINLYDLIKHKDFIFKLKKSKIVVTDGGSIQEECFYLGITTVIWRKKTERPYAMNKNMFISNFDINKSFDFIMDNSDKKYIPKSLDTSPSVEIYNFLQENNLIEI